MVAPDRLRALVGLALFNTVLADPPSVIDPERSPVTDGAALDELLDHRIE